MLLRLLPRSPPLHVFTLVGVVCLSVAAVLCLARSSDLSFRRRPAFVLHSDACLAAHLMMNGSSAS